MGQTVVPAGAVILGCHALEFLATARTIALDEVRCGLDSAGPALSGRTKVSHSSAIGPPKLLLVACRSEFVTANAAGEAVDARMLLLSEEGFASVTVITDAESGNGCSATGH